MCVCTIQLAITNHCLLLPVAVVIVAMMLPLPLRANTAFFPICFSFFFVKNFHILSIESSTLTIIYFHRWKNFFLGGDSLLLLLLGLLLCALSSLVLNFDCLLLLSQCEKLVTRIYIVQLYLCILSCLKLAKWLEGYIHHHRSTHVTHHLRVRTKKKQREKSPHKWYEHVWGMQ